MPAAGIATIAVAALLALTLVVAVGIIVVQLLRASRVLEDADGLLASMPSALSPVGPTVARLNRAIRKLVGQT